MSMASLQKEFEHLLPHIRYFESAVKLGNNDRIVEKLTQKGYTVSFVRLTIQALRRLEMKVSQTPGMYPGLGAKIRLHLKRLDVLNSFAVNMYARSGRNTTSKANNNNNGWYGIVQTTLTQALAHAKRGEKMLADATLEYASHMLDFLPPQNASVTFKQQDIQALRKEIMALRRAGMDQVQVPTTPPQKRAYTTQIKEYVDATHTHNTKTRSPVKIMTPGTSHITTTAYPLFMLILLMGVASQFL